MAGRRKPKGMTATEAAALPPEQRPDWYRPPRGTGNGSPPAEPFAPGNPSQLGAGYRSPRVYGRVAHALTVGLMETRPDLVGHPEALAAWADAEARAALLRHYLDEKGMFDDRGELRETLLQQLDRFERRADAARQRLGLDPRSEAELALLRARALREGHLSPRVDLDALAAQGREALDAGANDPVRAALAAVRAEADAAARQHTTDTEEAQP